MRVYRFALYADGHCFYSEVDLFGHVTEYVSVTAEPGAPIIWLPKRIGGPQRPLTKKRMPVHHPTSEREIATNFAKTMRAMLMKDQRSYSAAVKDAANHNRKIWEKAVRIRDWGTLLAFGNSYKIKPKALLHLAVALQIEVPDSAKDI